MRQEGAAWVMRGVPARYASGPGMGLCECGEYSPLLPNRAARKRWHREHKDQVRLRMEPAG